MVSTRNSQLTMTEQQHLFPRYQAKIASWSFNGEFGRNFERLINLQMWCFGCDIRNAAGNILTEFGFARTRPPAGTHGSTHYWIACDSMHTLHLWGFGMVITDNTGSLCLKRFERAPKIVEERFDSAPIFKPHDLPSFHQPRTTDQRETARRLLHRLCRELFRYETYITHQGLSSYRKVCVATSPKNARMRGMMQEPRDAWALLQSGNK
jgi:hypothetical protein